MGRHLGKHYSGGLSYLSRDGRSRVTLLPGVPVCATGYAARRIAADPERHTAAPNEVTCKACQRLIASAQQIGECPAQRDHVRAELATELLTLPSMEVVVWRSVEAGAICTALADTPALAHLKPQFAVEKALYDVRQALLAAQGASHGG